MSVKIVSFPMDYANFSELRALIVEHAMQFQFEYCTHSRY